MAGQADWGDGSDRLALGRRPLVAALTRRFHMASGQCKPSSCVVVEIPGAPRSRVVADLTTFTKTGFVFVRLEVASDAFFGGILETVSLMAALAGHVHMPTREWEA